jgi:DNA-binding SARP family transcriptional activator
MTRIVRGLRLPAPTPAPEHWPWSVRIRAFGAFSLEIDDSGAQQQPTGKAAHRLTGLLKALVAAGGIDVSGELLIDAIWPDAAGDTGWSSLHTTLHRLRRLLRHEEAIFVHDNKVSLSRTACWLDTWEFLDRTDAIETTAIETDALDERWAASLRAALALYRDHLLAGEADAPWLLAPRETMRQRWLAAVHALARWHERRRDRPGAAEVFRSATRIDPGDEGLCRGLMSSLADGGEPGEALASYERWERLARSRGMPAGEAINRLRDRLVAAVVQPERSVHRPSTPDCRTCS